MSQPQQTQTRLTFPQIGEVFELTASARITGLEMVRSFEYDPTDWESTTQTVPASTTKNFKLVQVGYQEDLAAVARACKGEGGKETSGVWMQVFDETFGHNGRNPVGVPDSSWVDPDCYARFPVVDGRGHQYFDWACLSWNDHWLWLVEVE